MASGPERPSTVLNSDILGLPTSRDPLRKNPGNRLLRNAERNHIFVQGDRNMTVHGTGRESHNLIVSVPSLHGKLMGEKQKQWQTVFLDCDCSYEIKNACFLKENLWQT